MSDFEDHVRATVNQISINLPGTSVFVHRDKKDEGGRLYMQVKCWRADTDTGEMGWGHGGKAYLSEYAIEGEIVRTAFGLLRAYWEHECREAFEWQGRRIFGPHISIDALHSVAEDTEHRR